MTLYSTIEGSAKLLFEGTFEDACEDFAGYSEVLIKRLYAISKNKTDIMTVGLRMVQHLQSIIQDLYDGNLDYLLDSNTSASPHTIVATIDTSDESWTGDLHDILSEILGQIADDVDTDDDSEEY